ncbi:MAG: threonine synthase [Gemmatimonadales bacterium]
MLDPLYDAAVWRTLDRDALVPDTIWTWSPFLPLSGSPRVSLATRGGPLVDAPQLARHLGLRRLRLKMDGYAYPSWSFKDRPVAVAINRALELGLRTVACPSTGNLAHSVAAQAAAAGLDAWILVPESIESTKTIASAVYGQHLVRVSGTYDEINALCREAASALGWGVVNVNLRAYYAEGSKTLAYEIAAESAWTPPSAVVAPMAGGALVTKLAQGFGELASLGWVSARPRIYGAQAEGCAPIVAAFGAHTETITPVTPNTICKSLAIGDPVDGRWAVHALRTTHGGGVAVSDAELVEGITTLASHEGVFTETAGGVVMAAAERLARAGTLTREDDVVMVLTGTGLKTTEALIGVVPEAPVIAPTLEALRSRV